jgi:hypothetical protein
MPIENTIHAYLIISLEFLIDDDILQDVFPVCHKEISQKDGEGSYEE